MTVLIAVTVPGKLLRMLDDRRAGEITRCLGSTNSLWPDITLSGTAKRALPQVNVLLSASSVPLNRFPDETGWTRPLIRLRILSDSDSARSRSWVLNSIVFAWSARCPAIHSSISWTVTSSR